MSEKLLYKFAILLTLLTLVCMGANYYIHPLPTHDGVWTLTPVFSAIQGYWAEDIFTGYRLPLLHYYLKIPFYLIMGNSIYGPFILNSIINLLYVFVIVKLAKKFDLPRLQSWLIVGLFISCNTFISLRPEHLINLFLLLYYGFHSRIKKEWVHIVISLLFLALHPAAGLFAILFNITNSKYAIKNILLDLGVLAISILAIIFIFPEFVQTMLYTMESRFEGNLHLPLFSFIKSCIFINFYYIYRCVAGNNMKRDLLQWLVFVILATLLGKDYYYDYVVVFVLYKCISMPHKNEYNSLQTVLTLVSVCVFPVWHLCLQVQNNSAESNLKQILYKIGEVVSQNDRLYEVPMEFALSAMGNQNVILEYHNLENGTYEPLLKNRHASRLVTEKKQVSQSPETHAVQWIPIEPNQKYCLFEIPSLPH
ncbi:MAG: hypothetical protein SGJ10_12120 [Bacteroidota bacterium]|nr:hypothetical protein [Bacteroidota bacterium]